MVRMGGVGRGIMRGREGGRERSGRREATGEE